MDLKGAALQLLLRPRVLHRLPGRLRVHLPLLSQIPADRPELLEMITTMVCIPDEILSAEATRETGNALIHYDPDRANEQDVMAFLTGLLKVWVRYRERLWNIPSERIPETTRELASVLRGGLRSRMSFDPGVEIPDDILA